MEWNNEVYTGTVSITILDECLLMVERAASAKVLLLPPLKDIRCAVVSTIQNKLIPC